MPRTSAVVGALVGLWVQVPVAIALNVGVLLCRGGRSRHILPVPGPLGLHFLWIVISQGGCMIRAHNISLVAVGAGQTLTVRLLW